MKAPPTTFALLFLVLLPFGCRTPAEGVEADVPPLPVAPEPQVATPAESSAPAKPVAAPPTPSFAEVVAGRYPRAGFELFEEDGRLWVFRSSSEELDRYRRLGEPDKHITLLGAGPGGVTMKSPEKEIILAYVAARPGFVTTIEGERIWAFAVGSDELEEFRRLGHVAQHVVRPGAGPLGMTVMAPDEDLVDAYLYSKEGFAVIPASGRLWVFREGSQELAEYRRTGEPAKHITRPGGGPDGKTILAPDSVTVLEYMAACEGFETFVRDGRIWVFRMGDPAIAEFSRSGEPAEHVTLPSAGPLSMTIKGKDRETLHAYLAQVEP